MDRGPARAGSLGPGRLVLGHLGGVVAGVVGDPPARGPLLEASGSSSLDRFGPQGKF